MGTHRDGLQQPVLRDAGGKLSQCVMIKGLARLVRVWLDLPQGQRFDPGVSLKAGGGVLKQTFQPPAKASSSFLP